MGEFITINSLFSKYLFAQRSYNIQTNRNGLPHTETKTQSITFCFDINCKETFKYLWSMFKHYQLEGTDEYIFVFYPRTSNDTQFINENFLSTLKSIDPPIDSEIESKIKIDFIDNRELSPVDTGR